MRGIGIRMQCPKCTARMYQPADEDGDWCCRLCGMRIYAGHDPSEEYWKQLQAQIPKRDAPAPSRDGRAGRTFRKKRYDLTA